MSKEYTVWCGLCTHWEQSSGSKTCCEKDFRLLGWKKDYKYGWICGKCKNKSGKEKEFCFEEN